MPVDYASGSTSRQEYKQTNPSGYWQNQASLVKSGTLGRETTSLATTNQLAQLGRSGYMELYPEVFHTMGQTTSDTPLWQWFAAKVQALANMKSQFYGPESTWIRWLIDSQIKDMADRAGRASRGNFIVNRPEIPEWAQEYLVPETITSTSRRGTTTRDVYKVRPLGAQAKLSPDQQRWLAGYMAYSQAGYPTKYSPTGIKEMSDIERWWSPFTTESESMMPTTKLSPRWSTAYQR